MYRLSCVPDSLPSRPCWCNRSGVFFLLADYLSQEFHKYSHMIDPPPVAKVLQGLGLSISRKRHGRHHSGPSMRSTASSAGSATAPWITSECESPPPLSRPRSLISSGKRAETPSKSIFRREPTVSGVAWTRPSRTTLRWRSSRDFRKNTGAAKTWCACRPGVRTGGNEYAALLRFRSDSLPLSLPPPPPSPPSPLRPFRFSAASGSWRGSCTR